MPEEPAARTVWVLCAPTVEDVVPTIRSRCRLLVLRTPPTEAVAAMLETRDGIDPDLAGFAARAAQGHIGRARALARDERVRERRAAVLAVAFELRDLGACLNAAAKLVEAAREEAKETTTDVDARERAELEQALGIGTKGIRNREGTAAVKELEEQQKARAKRWERDVLDRSLVDLMALYRDVLVLQTGAGAEHDVTGEDSSVSNSDRDVDADEGDFGDGGRIDAAAEDGEVGEYDGDVGETLFPL